MKVILSFKTLIVGFLFFIIYGCGNHSSNDNSSKPKTDLEKENLKGEVVLLDEGNKIIFFSEKGIVLKDFNGIKGLIAVRNYTYTNDKLQYTELKGRGFKDKTTYYYDQNGNLISTESITTFDGQDDISGIPFKSFYKYDNSGNLILDSVNENLFVRNYYTRNTIDSTIDNLKKIITIYSKGIPSKDLTYELNENGIRDVKSTTSYEYSYDSQGNWIQQKSFIDGKEDKVVNRTIIYKGGDIGQYQKKYDDFIASLSPNNNSNNNSNTKSSQSNKKPSVRVQKEKELCVFCKGYGSESCRECDGKGYYKSGSLCNRCDGTGRRICTWCNGTGRR